MAPASTVDMVAGHVETSVLALAVYSTSLLHSVDSVAARLNPSHAGCHMTPLTLSGIADVSNVSGNA